MRIHKQLILLLLFTTAIFIVALLVINITEQERRELLFNDFAASREQFFDKIVNLKDASLATFAYDYTYWDEMVMFVATGDKKWAAQNIDASLSTFKTDAVWIYNRDWKLIYFTSSGGVKISTQLPLPKSLYPTLFAKGPFCHFFLDTSSGLIEIHGASIHPTFDQDRKTPAKGYFFAGRIWSPAWMKDLADLTDSNLTLVSAQARPDYDSVSSGRVPQESNKNLEQTTIIFSRILKGWDERPVMKVVVRSESPIMKAYTQGVKREFAILLSFVLVMFFLLLVFLTRWISQPLRLITRSLDSQNPAYVNQLQTTSTEFGHIARLIKSFFNQKTALMNEIEEHKRTGAHLTQSLSLLHATLESTTDGILVVDRQGKVTSYNQKFLNLWQIPKSVAETKNNQTLLNYVLEQLKEPKQFFDKVMRLYANPEQQSFDTLEFKDGRIFERYSQPQRIEQEIVGRVWSFRDVSVRKYAEEEQHKNLLNLRKAMGGTIHALAAATEMRDPYTAGHQRRVANLARVIATEMNLPKEQIEGIRVAGTIHDIGKINIPAEILTKPTKLTDIEFALIKTHSQTGYDILKDIEFPWPIAEFVLQHHERLNGSGYPKKLTAEHILLEARIIAIADVVEAMATHRPYRPALGINEALAEIVKHKGILYDPHVVETCISLFSEKNFQFE